MAQRSAVVRLALYGAVYCLARATSRAQAAFAAPSTESTLAIHAEGITLMDLIYIGLTILFFLLALAYVRGCEKLQWPHLEEDQVWVLTLTQSSESLKWILNRSSEWRLRRFYLSILATPCCARRSFDDDAEWVATDLFVLRDHTVCDEADGYIHGPRLQSRENISRSGFATCRTFDLQAHGRKRTARNEVDWIRSRDVAVQRRLDDRSLFDPASSGSAAIQPAAVARSRFGCVRRFSV